MLNPPPTVPVVQAQGSGDVRRPGTGCRAFRGRLDLESQIEEDAPSCFSESLGRQPSPPTGWQKVCLLQRLQRCDSNPGGLLHACLAILQSHTERRCRIGRTGYRAAHDDGPMRLIVANVIEDDEGPRLVKSSFALRQQEYQVVVDVIDVAQSDLRHLSQPTTCDWLGLCCREVPRRSRLRLGSPMN